MAKRSKVLPARKQDRSRDEESLLMRSAESLGRMIGTLQRQLDGATKRLSETADDVGDAMPDVPFVGSGGSGARKGGARKGARKRSPSRTGAASARTATGTRSARTRSAGSRKAGQSRRRTTGTRSSKKR